MLRHAVPKNVVFGQADWWAAIPSSVAENPFRCRIQRRSRADAQRHVQGSDGEDTLMQAAVVRDKTRGGPSLTRQSYQRHTGLLHAVGDIIGFLWSA
jgi:hypothetical protein